MFAAELQELYSFRRSTRSRTPLIVCSFSAEANTKEVAAEEKGDVEKEEEEALDTSLSDIDDTDKHVSETVEEQYKQILLEKDDALTKLSEQIEVERKKVLSAFAEAENLRSRFARESIQTKKFAIQVDINPSDHASWIFKGFATNLFACLDNLDRAISSVPTKLIEAENSESINQEEVWRALKSLYSGVQMTQTEFGNVLKAHGIERFDPIDEAFDPTSHMARFEIDDPSKEPGTVAVVTLCGYRMHDRIIRPAEVGVVRQRSDAQMNESDKSTESSS